MAKPFFKYVNLALGCGTTLLHDTSGKRLNLLFSSKMIKSWNHNFIISATVLLCDTRQLS